MTPPGLTAYRLLTTAAAPLLPFVLKRRLRQGKEHPTRWRERLGYTDAARPRGPIIWLHGASVGEGLSLLSLVESLLAARPDLSVLVTTGTVTSADLLGARLPARTVHQFAPVDTPAAAARFLEHWRPDAAIFAESEVWPNLLANARSAGTPTALISARLSKASLANWARMSSSARVIFGGFDAVMAQDEAAAHALSALGARDDGRLNLKLFGAKLPSNVATAAAAEAALGDVPVVVAASTHSGEDEIVLDAFTQLGRPDAVLVIVPRHPERGEAVAASARLKGFNVARRSAGDEPSSGASVYVADTLGELGTWLSLVNARAAFVGGSLVAGPGGHNPLEAARLGVPIISGPHVQNWASVYKRLGDAVTTVQNAGELAAAFGSILEDPGASHAQADRASTAAEALAGDLGAVTKHLLALVERQR